MSAGLAAQVADEMVYISGENIALEKIKTKNQTKQTPQT